MDFSGTVNYGSNNYGKSSNVEHLLRACSDLEYADKLYGITYGSEGFPVIFNNTINNLELVSTDHFIKIKLIYV